MDLPAGPSAPSVVQLVDWVRRPLEVMERGLRRHGGVFTMRLPTTPPLVFFSDPAAVKEIFTADPDDARAGEANVILRGVLGENSLLLLDGGRHLRERKLMMPPFHGERMRTYGEVMRDATLRAMARWPRGKAFPLHPQTQAITLEVILRAVFGLDDEARLAEMRDVLVRWTDAGSSPVATALLFLTPPSQVDRLRTLAELPFGRFLPWYAVTQAKKQVDEMLIGEIRARRAGGADVLSLLVGARDEQGRPMTEEELHDEMLTLLAAGHETSATALTWAVHHLLEHPAWMEKLRTEIGSGEVDPERVARLDLLDAVVKETLRITPIIPLVARRLAKPMRIGGRDLPAGVVAVACIWLTHRRPDVWPDPERFDPTRFLGRKTDPYAYYPFGGGTRRCLGMAFAIYEMKIVLATILSRVSLSRAPGERVKVVRRGITLSPSGGMPVVAS